ncbi:hypothetical protein HPB51_022255 [Rhipicephalus microplus]|uniref:FAM234A/B beta-propeller domain-containing protein n=1 Tax=Rhipicephalus microplus TaxID=6941 RepID=A0A9J6DQP9_RHIMP|nr:hypothetical protein HPB51_022255 [Rhipicephalus microplus]
MPALGGMKEAMREFSEKKPQLTQECPFPSLARGLYAVSGRTGTVLWTLSAAEDAVVERSNMYTAQHIRDVDDDGTADLLIAHGGDPLREPGAPSDRLAGRLLVVSGRSGKLLSWAMVPDSRETYYSPQLMLYPDGTELVLFGTGGETHGGSLWSLPLRQLLAGRVDEARALYTDPNKGIMTPPALVDVTGDGVADVVMAAFNSTVFALDGLSLERLWSQRFVQSESYSTPAVGYFNEDRTPDFMVSYQTGPGFPLYVSSQTTVLDGRTGRPLLPLPVHSALGAQASPLAISMPGVGHDVFLYWLSDCHGDRSSVREHKEFALAAGTSVFLRSRADFCRLRFGSRLYTRLYALWSNAEPPGALLYDSGAVRCLCTLKTPDGEKFWSLPLHRLFYLYVNYQENYRKFTAKAPDSNSRPLRQQSCNLCPNTRYPSFYDEMLTGLRVVKGLELPKKALFCPTPNRQCQEAPSGREECFSERKHTQTTDIRKDLTSHFSALEPCGVLLLAHIADEMRSVEYSGLLNFTAIGTRFLEQHPEYHRIRRHVGPHDAGGVQRTISTGTLMPGSGPRSIDLVFATFWFLPTRVRTMSEDERRCLERIRMHEATRFQVDSPLYGLDHDAFEQLAAAECGKGDENDQPAYDPFNRRMGQLTVYRVRLQCTCDQCAGPLPFGQQRWPAYMGVSADCYSRKP